MMSPASFQALSLAIHKLSVRELELCSPRRLLTRVLQDGSGPLFRLPVKELERICHPDFLTGKIELNIRVDSSVNDHLREFREYAERQLGRPVSVVAAVVACAYAMNGEV